MPLTETVTSFVQAEYDRFMAGLQGLTPEGRANALRKVRQELEDAPGGATISIPGWDDVVHVAPRYPLAPEERRAIAAARRQGVEPAVSPRAVAEYDRRQGVRARIRSSAQPEYSNAFGQVLTALDNVGDFLTTVAVAGRIALWPAVRAINLVLPGVRPTTAEERALGLLRLRGPEGRAADLAARIAAERAATAALAARTAAGELVTATVRAEALAAARGAASLSVFQRFVPRTVGFALRGVPGLGWLLLARDLLNLAAWVGALAMPAYAAICRMSLEALAAGVPAVLFGRALQGKIWQQADLNPFSRVSRAARRARTFRFVPRVSEALEILQTTDQLWGIGVSFGAVVGAIMSGAYGVVRAVKGEPVTVQIGGASRAVTELHRSGMWDYSLADLEQRALAARVLQSLPLIWLDPDSHEEPDLIGALVAAHAALDLVGADLRGRPWQDLAAAAVEEAWAPMAPHDDGESVQAVLDEVTLEGFGRWPFPVAPGGPLGQDLVLDLWPRLASQLARWLEPRRDTVVAMLVGALVQTYVDRLFSLLEEDADFFHVELTPEYNALATLAENNRWLNVGLPEDRLWASWRALVGQVEAHGHGWGTPASLDALAIAHDAPLLTLLPPS